MNLLAILLIGFAAAPLAPLAVRASRRGSGLLLALVPLGLTAWLATLVPAALTDTPPALHVPWVPELGLALALRADALALLMALLITGLGTLIVLYAGEYLEEHPRLGGFQGWLLLFMASMLGLVLADDALLLFICWELTTVSSFFLVGFDSEREEARQAALRALLVTFLGGQALLLGLLLMGWVAGTLSLSQWHQAGPALREGPLALPILLLVLGGAFTKSAQVPFHFWLPGAMAAPTPASAYLHAATMVKAGVYLLARLSPVLGGTPAWQGALVAVGLVTMVGGALLSFGHTDMKLVLAYATVSVLGTLVLLLGLGTVAAAHAMVVFLLGHALYKGALFLAAGSVDHGTGTRELPRLGGLFKSMPFTGTAAGLAALSMAGLLPFFGFIGKELVYAASRREPGGWALAVGVALGFVLLVGTALRTGVRPFLGQRREAEPHAHESSPALWGPPLLLAAGGLALGLIPRWPEPLLAAAARSIAGPEEAGKLKLEAWHGVTAELGLSVASLLLGVAAFALREPLRRGLGALRFERWGPQRLYELSLSGLKGLAEVQTRVLQNGSLHRYTSVTVVTLVGLLSLPLLLRLGAPERALDELRPHEAAVLALMVVPTWVAVRTKSVLTALMALGVLGLGEAMVYVLLGAPDLALTQAVVQTLTVILFALVFSRFPVRPHAGHSRLRDALLSLAAGGLISWALLHTTTLPRHTRLAEAYTRLAPTEAHGLNLVNVILVDFRALDTLGEATVLATASLGVYLLFRTRRPRRRV